jgi:hypothetical protein
MTLVDPKRREGWRQRKKKKKKERGRPVPKRHEQIRRVKGSESQQ